MFYYNSLKNIEKNKLAKHIHTYIAKNNIIYIKIYKKKFKQIRTIIIEH